MLSTELVKAETYCDTVGDLGNCYVDGSVTASGDGKTPATAFKTIQEAADVVGPGDTVNVRGDTVYTDTQSCFYSSDLSMCLTSTSGTEINPIVFQAWPGTGIPIIQSESGLEISNSDFIEIKGFLFDLQPDTGVAIGYINGSKNGKVINNIISMGSQGIRLEASGNMKVLNNTIDSARTGISLNNYNSSNSTVEIRNNIFSNCSSTAVVFFFPEMNIDYNLFHGNTINYLSSELIGVDTIGANDVEADPKYMDASTNDYRFQIDSPARDIGLTLPEVSSDIKGTVRALGEAYDIGAFEYPEYYVDSQGGSDSLNSGQKNSPFETIQKASDVLLDGWGTINVKGDRVYDGPITPCYSGRTTLVCPAGSGSINNPILYRAWPGTGRPIMDGTNVTDVFRFIRKSYLHISGFEIKNAGQNPEATIGNADSIFVNDCDYCQIDNNYMHNSYQFGMRLNGESLVVKNNVISDNNDSSIYITGSDDSKYFILNNIIKDNKNIGGLFANVLITAFQEDVFFLNNTVVNNSIEGDLENNLMLLGVNVFFKNNIIANNDGCLMVTAISSLSFSNNIEWNNGGIIELHEDWNAPIDKDSSNKIVDPYFISNDNYQLRSNSPGVDNGETLPMIDTDILGITRPQGVAYDIGAFEYYDVSVSLNELTPDPTNNNSPTLTGSSNAANGTIYQVKYSLNGGDWFNATASDGSFNASSEDYTIPLNDLADGKYTIKVKAIDSYGSETSPNDYASDTFVVDTTIPNPKLTQLGTLSVTLDNVNGAHWYYTGTKPKFIGTSEANSTTKFTIEEVDSKDINVSSEGSWDYENQLTTKTYEVSFFGRDAAGNVSDTQSFLLTIDPTAQSFPDYIKEKLGVGMTSDEKQEEVINDEAGEEDLIIEESNGDLYEAEEVPEDNTGDDADSQPSEPEGDTGQISGQSIFQQAGFWLLCVLPLAILLIVLILIYVKKKNDEDQ